MTWSQILRLQLLPWRRQNPSLLIIEMNRAVNNYISNGYCFFWIESEWRAGRIMCQSRMIRMPAFVMNSERLMLASPVLWTYLLLKATVNVSQRWDLGSSRRRNEAEGRVMCDCDWSVPLVAGRWCGALSCAPIPWYGERVSLCDLADFTSPGFHRGFLGFPQLYNLWSGNIRRNSYIFKRTSPFRSLLKVPRACRHHQRAIPVVNCDM